MTERIDPATAVWRMKQARQEAAERQERRELMEEYPYLTPIGEDWMENRKILTKNIKAMLKHHYPDIKFSVQRRNFSGGFDYSITWTNDGPMEERWKQEDDIKKLVAVFTRPSEYGMDDSFISYDSPFTKVFGGMPYLINCYCRRI